MGNCKDIDDILRRNGTGQAERYIAQLDPASFQLNDLTIEDWILFTYNFAKHANYFDTQNNTTAQGDWQDFFNCFGIEETTIPFRTSKKYITYKDRVTQTLEQVTKDGTLTPHLTLFVCFLHLMELSKERFNLLTKRHLDFYYNEILQVDKREPIPDKVHVIFELAKKSVEERVVESSELNAKQDSAGNPLIYATNEELIANQAKVSALKTVYNDVAAKELKSSAVANTKDGFEEPLPEDKPYWLPFGYPSAEKDFTTLPDATIGFAIASPMLALQEGKRKVEITLSFEEETITTKHKLENFNTPESIESLKQVITVYGSGSEKWIGPFDLKVDDVEAEMITTVIDNDTLVLAFELDKDDDAIINYDPEFLLEQYNTSFPVVRFQIDLRAKGDAAVGHDFYRAMVNRVLSQIKVKVDVQEASSVIVENDTGVLKSKKPFFPFTPQPIKGSNFYIDYPEAFAKGWTRFEVNFDWKNTPESFKEWYKAYLKPSLSRNTAEKYLDAAKIDDANSITDDELVVKNETHFKVIKSILHEEEWEEFTTQEALFAAITEENDEGTKVVIGHNFSTALTNTDAYKIDKAGPISLSLNTSFLHELFPRIYALALTDISQKTLIPNEAYTPIAENITINYIAEETRDVKSQNTTEESPILTENTETSYQDNRIQLFHIHPFGQCEEHNHLKYKKYIRGIVDAYDISTMQAALVPKYCQGGELFIGLEDAKVQQSVSLLVQVLEGSENTETTTFGEQERIQWAVLCEDQWKSIQNDITGNSTDNFLTSGIVKFNIPREATTTNTRLPEGYIWIRAKMHRAYNAACKVINIHTQAIQATLNNKANVLDHLEKGLPAETIKKLITRIPQVKGVTQPYNSFDGIPEESDLNFYRRISERLRHKNRAITLWDYEHLILQEFPEIFKVKCLNHTHIEAQEGATIDHHQAAGHVTLVVIPDSINKNVFDIHQPRVSTGLINKIRRFINQFNTMHVNAEVINPDYEEIKITLEVQFYEGYDESFYKKQLEDDITKFLSPWAFDTQEEIIFGIALHRSVLIDYMEKLPYVDYLQMVEIAKNNITVTENLVTPTAPKSILVSAKSHTIKTVTSSCKEIKKPEKLICQ